MTTIDRHIIRRLMTAFVLLIGLLIVFFVVLHYVEYVDEFFDNGATSREVFLQYYPSYVPEIVKLVSPVALFLSTIYLTSKLAQKLQIVALSTSGVSLYRLMRPYLLVGVFVTGFMFWFNGWIVPTANQQRMAFEEQYLNNGSSAVDDTDIYRRNAPGSIVSIGYYNRKKQVAYNVSLLTYNQQKHLKERIDTPSMHWIDSLQQWQFPKATRRTFNKQQMQQQPIASLDTTLNLYPRDIVRSAQDVNRLTLPEAANFIETLRRSGAGNMGRPLVAYYSKYTYPLANFILVLLGVPLAAVRRRGGQAVQIGLGFLVTFLYLALIKLVEPFGFMQTVSPLVAASLPHLVFLLLGLGCVLFTRK